MGDMVWPGEGMSPEACTLPDGNKPALTDSGQRDCGWGQFSLLTVLKVPGPPGTVS